MICLNDNGTMAPYFVKKGFRILRCGVCRLMAVENIPEDLRPYYNEGYFTGDTSLDGYMDYDFEKRISQQSYLNFLNKIRSFVSKDKGVKLFEVGCATGFFLKLASENGWEAEGIDISEYAVKKAIVSGLNVSVGTMDTYMTDKKFDAVVMQDVIEHVKDPLNLVNKAREILGEHGVLALTTPDSGSLWARVWGKRWHAFVPPQHLFYFSAANLKTLLEKNSFKVRYIRHHGKKFTVPYIFRLLHSWTGLKLFSILAEKLSDTFLRKIAVSINVGDTVYLIAEKIN